MIALRDSLLLTVLVALVFGSSLTAPFLLDDLYLTSHPTLTTPSGWREAFHLTQTRPIPWLTYWVNFQWGNGAAEWFHLTNLAVHWVCVLLLRHTLGLRLTGGEAMLAAAVFAVHPVQTQAVVWVSARPVLLAALFCLISLGLWFRQRYWAAALVFPLALLSKEESVGFPVVLLMLYYFGQREPQARLPLLVMFGGSLAAGLRSAWATAAVPGSGAGLQAGVGVGDYFLAQSIAIWRYVRLVLFPWGFSIDPEIAAPPAWLGLLLWTGILAAVLLLARRARSLGAAFWLLAAFVLLLPSSSLLPAADLAADRRLYLPMAAIAAAGALLLPVSRLWACGFYVAFLSVLCIAEVQVWRSPETLWREAVRQAPQKVRPRIQLARSLPPRDAVTVLEQARQIHPEDERIAAELGRFYLLTGQAAKALPEFGRALARNPNSPNALNNRGLALLALKQMDAAREDFQRALALDPCHFNARFNLKQCGASTQPPAQCAFTAEQRRLLSDP